MSEVFYRRLATAAVFAGLFGFAAVLCLTSACLNQISLFYHVRLDVLGRLFLWQSGTFFVTVLIAGRLSDRWRRLPVLAIGCLTMGFGAFMVSRASSFSTLVGAMFVMGGGGGFIEGMCMTVIADLYSAERRTAMLNGSQVFFAIGAVASPVFAARVIAHGGDWRVCFLVAAGACLVAHALALASALARRERSVAHHRHEYPWTKMLFDPMIIALSVGILLYVAAESGEGSWLAVHFRRGLGSAETLAALSVAFFWGGIGLGRLVTVWLSRHLSDTKIIIGALTLAAASQTLLMILRSPTFAMIAVVLLGCSLAPVWPTILSRAGALYPRQSGTVFGVLVAMGAAGAALFPPIIGQVAQKLGILAALWGCVGILAANLILFVIVRKPLAGRTANSTICEPASVSEE